MKISFYLERKALKSPERAIYCYIRGISPKKEIILNTKEKILPEHWDSNSQRAIDRGKKKYICAKELNNFLNSYEEEIKKTELQLRALNPVIEYDEIRTAIIEKFGKTAKQYLSFFEAIDKYSEIRKKDLSHHTLRKYKTIKKHLESFSKVSKGELNWNKIDLLFYDQFLTYLIEKKELSNNSAYKIIGLLKNFLNWAYERGINPFNHFKKFKIKEDKVEIITLSRKEIDILYNLDLKSNERLNKARDLFLFGCFTGGRFGDLVKLERDDIKNDKWLLRVGKTRDVLEIPLSNYATCILAKYAENEFPLPRISNQKLNVYIKEVCKLAELNEVHRISRFKGSEQILKESPKWQIVTVHTARRTFITQSLLRGMRAEVVMSISGHKNYKTFKKYIDITSNTKDNEMNKAWNEVPDLKIVNFGR